ncbi:MAG: hypothetical protein ACE5JG_10270 [Planctomycetota bacterium]
MSDNLRKRLEQLDPQLPRSWRPRPGSILVGTVRRYDRAESAYGPRWICIVEEQETGEPVGVWISHKVLDSEFKAKRPRPGERIGIRRLDDSEKGYARYVLLVEGRSLEREVPDFEELSEPGDVPPEELAAAALQAEDDLPF